MFASASWANCVAIAASKRALAPVMTTPALNDCQAFVAPGRSRNPLLPASGGFARRLLALVFLQETLPDPDRFRRDLDELVVGDELDRVFERQRDRRCQQNCIVLAGCANVR